MQNESDESLPPLGPLPEIRREDNPKLLTDPEPPLLGSPLTANTKFDEEDEPSTDPLSLPAVGLLNREPLPSQQNKNHAVIQPLSEKSKDEPAPMTMPAPQFSPSVTPAQPGANATNGPIITPPAVHPAGEAQSKPAANSVKTLSEIEEEVDSPHLSDTSVPLMPTPAQPTSSVIQPSVTQLPQNNPLPTTPPPAAPAATSVDDARSAVEQALNGGTDVTENPGPIQALNARPLSYGLHDNNAQAPIAVPPQPQQPVSFEPTPPVGPQGNGQAPSSVPPAVPPPMMPPTFPGQQ